MGFLIYTLNIFKAVQSLSKALEITTVEYSDKTLCMSYSATRSHVALYFKMTLIYLKCVGETV